MKKHIEVVEHLVDEVVHGHGESIEVECKETHHVSFWRGRVLSPGSGPSHSTSTVWGGSSPRATSTSRCASNTVERSHRRKEDDEEGQDMTDEAVNEATSRGNKSPRNQRTRASNEKHS